MAVSTETTRQHVPANNATLLRENNLQYTKQRYRHKNAVLQRYEFGFLCALAQASEQVRTHARTHTHTKRTLLFPINRKEDKLVLPAVRVFKCLHPVSTVTTPATQTVQSGPRSPCSITYGKDSLYNVTHVLYTKYSYNTRE